MSLNSVDRSVIKGINPDLLFAYGAVSIKLQKADIIFFEDKPAYHYYQLLSGRVRMFNQGAEGKEFTQGYFEAGDSFGEPPLFVDATYPASAQSCCDSVLLKLSKDKFFQLLDHHPENMQVLLKVLSRRVLNKSAASKSNAMHNAEERILTLLRNYKLANPGTNGHTVIPYTRQEIAHLTSLRVETVIRSIAKLSSEGLLVIKDRKLLI